MISFDTNINPAFVVALAGFGYKYWRDRKDDQEKRNKMHAENTEKLDGIVTELRYYPAHKHTERIGVLEASGIQPQR